MKPPINIIFDVVSTAVLGSAVLYIWYVVIRHFWR